MTQSEYARRQGDPSICDFVLGNPQEMPLPGFVEAVQRWVPPQNKDWFAYKMSEAPARAAIASSLRQRRGMPFEDEDIFITNGGFAAIAVALRTVVDPGDEVIFLSPPWFFYELLIHSVGGEPVRVRVDRDSFDLDLEAIAAAITPRTRAIIVNSPNNPTGVIYPPESLRGLAALLEEASARHGRPIYLLSDEAYCRIVFDDQPFHSPASFYPNTFVLYTYGKTLLTPGQRLGYVALPPTMPGREELRSGVLLAQLMLGHAVANAVMQYALPELEQLSIDVAQLQRRRDVLVESLREDGYELHVPQGTFYLLPRSPIPDDLAFTRLLAEQDVFVLPGTIAEMPGYFRISLTANDGMVERALPRFGTAMRQARALAPSTSA
jgi:aspartate aminotransferase